MDTNHPWHGWPQLPLPSARPEDGGWHELSHVLSEGLKRTPSFPKPRIEKLLCMPGDRLNLTEIQMVCHFGTHLDAPCHFILDAPALHQIPLERMYGPGVVWRIEVEPDGLIEPTHLAAARPAARPGDIVLIDSGFHLDIETDRYERHPSLSPDAARWLVDQGVKLLGVDFATPDLAHGRRGEGFNWPVHHILLSRGVLIGEHLTNLRPLSGRRVEVIFLALNIQHADGAPARVIARPAADG
ncbi:MAG: cyclase family protein [Kiloniellales bacterium]